MAEEREAGELRRSEEDEDLLDLKEEEEEREDLGFELMEALRVLFKEDLVVPFLE